MLVGVPKEIKNHEYRVGLTPAAVKEFVAHGHQVMVETNAGTAIGFTDELYQNAGAMIVDTAEQIFAEAEMIVKVKEPQPSECKQLRKGQTLYTYLHLAPDPVQTELLIASGATCIAYETVTDRNGGLPLLAPMSEVAGRMSVQAGAHYLEKAHGGSGTLLGGVPGVAPGKVLIIGGGVVGTQAAKMALGLGADVTILDRSLPRLRQLDDIFNGQVKTVYSTVDAIEHYSANADLVVGAVLIPGAAAPKLLNREHIKNMKPGSVLVDVAIDQGGCFETSKATTHQDPVYIIDDVVHYCVANMPGGVARTSTMALNNATLPFGLALANKGPKQAMLEDIHLLNGLNVHEGKVTYQAVVEALGEQLGITYTPALDALR
ncbi:alanine dehydrogenase [Marisediminitalea aggregata]|uniref:Alanine dehydrogenase n=1 Tax=Marisediminitalea aggregata TaxID=634436 RepID=A0A1M5PXL9_9ALTE|nr:alanine dehydrogenase [Marisediminitalea aggregata]MAH55934.1 alanine dehydrogenase [Aestuariibacter sp.]MAP21535.1 alanine dehydrogenase [Alteromonadaceae bacterium]MEC7823077.1 alanine dehydrogenase [Pseudomonadota bacterium]BBO27880.1 alanine dehydrogenase [Alteromonas sp. I4]HBY39519.1 alanine dehydrogenase [Alteromonas sp.]|tara:strand:- start:3412 stop:4539 length:1128 start_codon:yes stop_codon:yes gene_type:complete